MKYLCLIYVDEKEIDETDPEVVQAVTNDCLAHTEELNRDGQLIACERLEPVRTAVTVRTQNGKVSATDGPFAETKEQLGGFYLINARDIDEAKQIAARIPRAASAVWKCVPSRADVHRTRGRRCERLPGASATESPAAACG